MGPLSLPSFPLPQAEGPKPAPAAGALHGPVSATFVRRQCGFTLIELVVVLMVMVLALGALGLSMHRVVDSAQYRSTVRDLLTEMRTARQTAMRTGAEVVFQYDPEARAFGRSGDLRHRVPAALAVEFVGARSEITADGVGQIRFFPDGSSTGGSVILTRLAGGGVQLRVSWLLGRVTQHPV